MIRSEKKLAALSGLLKKENTIAISSELASLRNEEPFEGAIGLIVSLYDRTDDESLKRAIELFMNDLKDPSSRPEVMAEIKKHRKGMTASMLVSSCWQSGQDYSEYADDFIRIFIPADYATAIECLTVITESLPGLSRERKERMIRMLDESDQQSADKAALTAEMRSVLLESPA